MDYEAHVLLVGAGQRRSSAEFTKVVDAFRWTAVDGMAHIAGDSDVQRVVQACALRMTSDLIIVLTYPGDFRSDLAEAVLQAAAQHRFPGTFENLLSQMTEAGRPQDAEKLRNYRI